MNCQILNDKNELSEICKIVRQFIQQRNYTECEKLIFDAMSKHPHAPEPHNLIGVLLEKEGKHAAAMKHFLAAWALDPTYIPARHNLNLYSSFYPKGTCAFDESECSGNE